MQVFTQLVQDRARLLTLSITLLLLAACGGAASPTPTSAPSPTSPPAAVPTPTPEPTPTSAPTPTHAAMVTPTMAHAYAATPTMGMQHDHGAMMGGTPAATGPEVTAGPLVIRGAWARPATASDGVSAVFLTIENTGDQPDRLLHAHCDVAETVELHETIMENSVMKMRPVDGIDIPAHGSVVVRPGGLHIMLIGLKRDLNPGDEVEVELHFDQAKHVSIHAVVTQP